MYIGTEWYTTTHHNASYLAVGTGVELFSSCLQSRQQQQRQQQQQQQQNGWGMYVRHPIHYSFIFDPFKADVPFWGQTSQIPGSLSPKTGLPAALSVLRWNYVALPPMARWTSTDSRPGGYTHTRHILHTPLLWQKKRKKTMRMNTYVCMHRGKVRLISLATFRWLYVLLL